ncbi:hypothetical protein [Psychromarinibacter halotolerans]|uniref:Uncharacterized protein n=1 Tax=Psychromarinibacter halotolerans TaxID=1775175 RepID=A0ABV7GPH3_9RHOB|nr:hypothetical protein [Psychromarinibacter halotolerans]MAQ86406.1 hypothetical protein [Maritimibacter sp.]MDF0597133.1 hypothetical protein [Psychromarinibacter halotolerans]
MRKVIVAAVLTVVSAGAANANAIERACLSSARAGASPQLCGCIQAVADRTLSSSDQRMAARFFKDPHMAQEIRQSDNASHEVFWKRYKVFGATAESHCR